MRRLLLAALAALALAAPANAAAPQVTARAYLVVNAADGQVLAASRPHTRLPMASITKLMTVLVTLEHAKPDDVVTIGPQAAVVGESSVHLVPGEQLTVRDLLKAALIQSANDAAFALAAHVGRGDVGAFVTLMNAKARELGLADTHFVRPDGLDAPGHVSSAADLTRLAEIAMHDRTVRAIVRERSDTIAGGRRVYTWNDLLGEFDGLIGVKTGHTAAAGWCEVAAARGAGVTIYATILGSPSRSQRNADLSKLLRYGLSRYRVLPVIETSTIYARAETGYGRAPIDLVPARPLKSAVRVDRPLIQRLVAPGAVELPVERGERIGEITVYSGDRLLGSRPLVAARDVSRPGLGGRIAWYAGRTVHNLFGMLPL